jgi:hypothetical protein
MGFELRRLEQNALVKHLLAQDWDVFGTLKFVNGRTIGRKTAHLLLRSYWNSVDRVFFGKAAERQDLRIPRWCFAHEGSDSENFHVHFVLKAPMADVDQTCCVLNAVWSQHHAQTAPLKKNWIMPATDRVAVSSYLTREYWRMGSSTFLDELSWDRPLPNPTEQSAHHQQAYRILRAASPLWQRQAQQALDEQKAQYQESGDLQMMERG